MKIKSLILRNWYKLIYILITIIYIIFLKRLDKKLLAKNFANSIQLLSSKVFYIGTYHSYMWLLVDNKNDSQF